jgi:hypothetical protein
VRTKAASRWRGLLVVTCTVLGLLAALWALHSSLYYSCREYALFFGITEDVTEDAERWGGFVRDGIYVLRTDMFLYHNGINQESAFRTTEIPAPKDRKPTSFKEYCRNPNAYPAFRILSAGTRLRVDRIVLDEAALRGAIVVVEAEILVAEDPGLIGKRVTLGSGCRSYDGNVKRTSIGRPNADYLLLYEAEDPKD